ncbi:MAG: hypothetical protein OEV91_01560 [Desulfobulbaceae bacterium]|nr:hypothetical protein [Desulfobulbaceae bacterium]
MEADIARVLSYEIKKEMADRYFGFRKLIEEDTLNLHRKMHVQSRTVEQAVGHGLVRLYILLGDETLIHEFLLLAGLEEQIFYDPYLLESPTLRARALAGMRVRGFTRAGRFQNLVLDSYQLLVENVVNYRERFGELEESLETIKEEIQLFYRKNDLGSIMQFFRAMDSHGNEGPLYSDLGAGATEHLEKSLRIEPPSPIDHLLPVIPPLMPLKSVGKPLKRLAARAYRLHQQRI